MTHRQVPPFLGLLSRIVPRRITTQLALLMFVALLVLATIFSFSILWTRPQAPLSVGGELMQIGGVLAVLNEKAPNERAAYLEQVSKAGTFHVSLLPGRVSDFLPQGRGGARVASDTNSDPVLEELPAPELQVDEFPPPAPFLPFQDGMNFNGVKIVRSQETPSADGTADNIEIIFAFEDGSLAKALVYAPKAPPLLGNPLVQLVCFLVLSVLLLLFWATQSIVKPLGMLVSAVRSFGVAGTDPVLLKEDGPEEVEAAARAFNRMQARINELVERRTRFLAAIGHDLRTPLTRLRLRAELIEDDDLRERTCQDLDTMEAQLTGVLTYLKEGRSGEAVVPVDLFSVFQSIVDLYEDAGESVGLECEPGLEVQGRPTELQRAVTNLVQNALFYAGDATIKASRDGAQAVIDVIDHGPGIPEEDRERMLNEFERGDRARKVQEKTGFGLGLAITKTIAEAHGGQIALLSSSGGGLTVRITLPALD